MWGRREGEIMFNGGKTFFWGRENLFLAVENFCWKGNFQGVPPLYETLMRFMPTRYTNMRNGWLPTPPIQYCTRWLADLPPQKSSPHIVRQRLHPFGPHCLPSTAPMRGVVWTSDVKVHLTIHSSVSSIPSSKR